TMLESWEEGEIVVEVLGDVPRVVLPKESRFLLRARQDLPMGDEVFVERRGGALVGADDEEGRSQTHATNGYAHAASSARGGVPRWRSSYTVSLTLAASTGNRSPSATRSSYVNRQSGASSTVTSIPR